MALVSYDLSSESEGEDLATTEIKVIKNEDISQAKQTARQKVKISVPSLSDLEDPTTQEPLTKNITIFKNGNTLLDILPPVEATPLTTKSFVPHIVKNRPVSTVSKQTVLKKKIEAKTPIQAKKKRKEIQGSESDSDSDHEYVPETFDDELWEKVCGRSKSNQTKKVVRKPTLNESDSRTCINIAPEPEKPYDGLNNEAFRELMETMKRPIGKVKLMDLSEESVVPDTDLWITRSLTDPEMAPPKEPVEEPVDPTKRKKHHITYLAQLAKEKEEEYKCAWATSKNNRLMSRAKYGF